MAYLLALSAGNGSSSRWKDLYPRYAAFIGNSPSTAFDNSSISLDADPYPEIAYTYDHRGVRVRQSSSVGTVTYLNDHLNATGYTKAVEEFADTDGDSAIDESRGYVFGIHFIAQGSSDDLYQVILDGHGSTRLLVNAQGQLVQNYEYDAYGRLLNMGADEAYTNWLFGSDGIYDPASGWIYHLARWREGFRFVSYDSSEADPASPAALHKYLYASANPVVFVDSSGLFFNYVDAMSITSIRNVLERSRVLPALSAVDKTQTFGDAVKLAVQFATTGTVDPILLSGLLGSAVPFGKLLRKAKLLGNKLIGVTDELNDIARRLTDSGLHIADKKVVQTIGDVGAISVARKLGFKPTAFPTRYHGIDGVLKHPDGRFILVEAKGGTSNLSMTKYGEQLSQGWIQRKIDILKKHDPKWAKELEDAIAAGKLEVLCVSVPINGKVVGDPTYVLKSYGQLGARTFLR